MALYQSYKKKIRTESVGFKVFAITMLVLLALIMVLPIFVIVNTSLKTKAEFGADPMGLFSFKPLNLLFENYGNAFDKLNILSRLLYTVAITVGSALIACIVVSLIAYPLARSHFAGSGKVFVFVLASTFLPGSLIANIFLIRAIGLYNTPFVLILFWGFGGLMVYIFMVMQFIKGVPKDLDEAAFMDGCGYYKYIFRIVIPLIRPILTTVFILKLVGAWNDFLTPYIYIVDSRFMTIATGLYKFNSSGNTKNWPALAAATVTVALPVIILYGIMQRFIIEGMAAGALKG